MSEKRTNLLHSLAGLCLFPAPVPFTPLIEVLSTGLMEKKENPHYKFLNLENDSETIRCVEPYVFDYTTFAKGRWLKRALIDVLTQEFGGYEVSYWHRYRDYNVQLTISHALDSHPVFFVHKGYFKRTSHCQQPVHNTDLCYSK